MPSINITFNRPVCGRSFLAFPTAVPGMYVIVEIFERRETNFFLFSQHSIHKKII
jgi:hypothetical protein